METINPSRRVWRRVSIEVCLSVFLGFGPDRHAHLESSNKNGARFAPSVLFHQFV